MSLIPKNIFMTWGNKDIPILLKQRIHQIKKENPDFNIYIYDDIDCMRFLANNFPSQILNTYIALRPGAYKADLWRCCILFKFGGIYMDIKLAPINGFKLNSLVNQEHFVKDRPKYSIYNALIVSKNKNLFLKATIINIMNNVRMNYYGNSPLDPTGPILMGKIANNMNIKPNLIHAPEGGYILQNNKPIISTEFKEYDSIRKTMTNKQKNPRYDIAWKNRKIYFRMPKILNFVGYFKNKKANPIKI
jgi:mannosyltransferase OCH1-like enzyme